MTKEEFVNFLEGYVPAYDIKGLCAMCKNDPKIMSELAKYIVDNDLACKNADVDVDEYPKLEKILMKAHELYQGI